MSLSINATPFPAGTLHGLGSQQIRFDGALQRLPADRQIDSPSDAAVVLGLSGYAPIFGLPSVAGIANDSASLLQTADDALGSVQANLLALRERAVEAARATGSQSWREALQAEAMQLAARIDRISSQAAFHGIQVFDQNRANVPGDPSLLAVLKRLKGGWLENAEKLIRIYYGLKADGAALNIDLTGFTDGPYGVAARVTANAPSYGPGKGANLKLQIDRADFVPLNPPDGGSAPLYDDRIIVHEMTHAVMARTMNYADLTRNALWFVEGTAEFIHGADERFAADLAQSGGSVQRIVNALSDGLLSASIDYSAAYAAVRYLHAEIKAAGGAGIKDVMDFLSANQSATLDDAFRKAVATLGGAVSGYISATAFLADFNRNGAAFIAADLDLANDDTGAIGGLDADGGPAWTAESVVPDTGTRSGDNVLAGFTEYFETIAGGQSRTAPGFQTDAYAGKARKAVAGAMNASALGINALNLLEDPADAIGQADRAIQYVNAERARISAQLNRFGPMFAKLQNVFASLGTRLPWTFSSGSPAELAALIGSRIRTDPVTATLAQANIPKPIALHLLLPG